MVNKDFFREIHFFVEESFFIGWKNGFWIIKKMWKQFCGADNLLVKKVFWWEKKLLKKRFLMTFFLWKTIVGKTTFLKEKIIFGQKKVSFDKNCFCVWTIVLVTRVFGHYCHNCHYCHYFHYCHYCPYCHYRHYYHISRKVSRI